MVERGGFCYIRGEFNLVKLIVKVLYRTQVLFRVAWKDRVSLVVVVLLIGTTLLQVMIFRFLRNNSLVAMVVEGELAIIEVVLLLVLLLLLLTGLVVYQTTPFPVMVSLIHHDHIRFPKGLFNTVMLRFLNVNDLWLSDPQM